MKNGGMSDLKIWDLPGGHWMRYCFAMPMIQWSVWYDTCLKDVCLIRSDTLSHIFNDDKDTCLNDPQESKMKKSESWEPGKAFFLFFPGLLVLPEGGRPVHIACSLRRPRSKRWGSARFDISRCWSRGRSQGQLLMVPGHDVSLYVKDNLPKIMLVAWFSAAPFHLTAAKKTNWHWNWTPINWAKCEL